MQRRAFIDQKANWFFPLPAVLFIVIMMIFPVLYTVRNSLTGWSLGTGTPDVFVGLANYGALLHDPRFLTSILRTFYFTGLAVAFEVVLGVAIALLLNRDTRGKNIVNAIFLLPMMATPVAIAMVWLLMYEPTVGIANYILQTMHLPRQLWIASSESSIPALVLVDVWEWTPMITLITLAGLASLPSDPFEAARVDGASPWQMTWKITLPLLLPTVTIAALLRLIDALKTFDIIYTMTGGGPNYSSETINIYAYQQAFSYYNFGYASSILVIFFTIIVGITLLVTYTRNALEV
ncbi:MAG: sugar ABC transporter permease [Ktedonobacteraceae bacterium]